jgi:adenylate cyclase
MPAYGDLARANLRAVGEGLFVRRLIINRFVAPDDHKALAELKAAADKKAAQTQAELADARQLIGREIAKGRNPEDIAQLSGLDARTEFLQTRHKEYEAARAAVEAVVEAGITAAWQEKIQELDRVRDLLNDELEQTRRDMLKLAAAFGQMVELAQGSAARYGLVLLILALALGAAMAAIIAAGLVRPLRRLVQGTIRVQQGTLDTEVPVTSRDEVGELTAGFNAMMKDLRAKAQIRETFYSGTGRPSIVGRNPLTKLEATNEERSGIAVHGDADHACSQRRLGEVDESTDFLWHPPVLRNDKAHRDGLDFKRFEHDLQSSCGDMVRALIGIELG